MQARWYSPDTATFLSVDPVVGAVADVQSHNGYSYARNNPIAFDDPTGKSFATKGRSGSLWGWLKSFIKRLFGPGEGGGGGGSGGSGNGDKSQRRPHKHNIIIAYGRHRGGAPAGIPKPPNWTQGTPTATTIASLNPRPIAEDVGDELIDRVLEEEKRSLERRRRDFEKRREIDRIRRQEEERLEKERQERNLERLKELTPRPIDPSDIMIDQ